MNRVTTAEPPDTGTPAGGGVEPPDSGARSPGWATAARQVKWLVVVIWLALVLVTGPLDGKLTGVENNDATSYLPRSAESTQALDVLNRAAGGPSGPVATVVYARSGGLTDADRARVDADRGNLGAYAEGGTVGPGVPSTDGGAVLLTVPLKRGTSGDQTIDVVHQMRSIVKRDSPPGLQVSVTGQAGQLADLLGSFGSINNTLLLVTILAVAVVLLLTYRSPVLWLVPLLCVGIAYTVAGGVLYVLASQAGLTVSSESAGILPALMFGAGTDYALLLIARYREELHLHRDRHAAMRRALRRAVPAMLASASTVVLGLLCLLVAQLNSDRGLGPVGAVGIASAFLAMTTLLPALLVVFGRWLFWPFTPRYSAATTGPDHRAWERIGAWIAARPRTIWISVAVVLLLLSAGLTQAKIGLNESQTFRVPMDSVTGQALLAAHYPPGLSDPTIVVARSSGAQAVADAARGTSGVVTLLPTRPLGDYAVITVVLADSPDSIAAEDTVARLRQAVHAVPGADAMVTGTTAVSLDTRDAAVVDERTVFPLVLLVVLVVLVVLLRALVAPLLLIATVVLSFGAALGASTLLFQRVLGFGALDFSVPLLGFVFLVALGVDYNIFLMTRAHEEVADRGHAPGLLRALAMTGGVITSAGIVLAATFSALAVLTLVSLVQLGMLVALGVLLDTFIVRSVLVPALGLDVGRAIWWPSRLGREEPAGRS